MMAECYRYKIIIEYLGSSFCGWQRQSNGISAQEVLEKAIYQLSREKVIVFGAGRTDSGVHALAQVAHFDLTTKYYSPLQIMSAINYFVRPHKIVVTACEIINEKFHARFSAIARHYLYKIINRPNKIILEENRAWWIKEPLDLKKMQIAANYLIGNHDFSSFRASHCQAKSAVKTLSKIELIKNNNEIKCYISAPSFLHHMVRNIIGTLRMVGNGKLEPDEIKYILDAKDRSKAGPTAPACGLYFFGVDYD